MSKKIGGNSQIGDARAADALISSLKDSDRGVREAAAWALGKIGDARAVDPLIKVLEDKEDRVQQTAAEALDQLGWKPDLNESGALYWIAKCDFQKCVPIGAPAVDPLFKALSDRNSAAVDALSQLGAVDQLINALNNHSKKVREAASRSLVYIAQKNPKSIWAKWDTIKSTSEERHQDEEKRSNSDCTSWHADKGIGVPFPDKPKGGDF